MAMAGELIAGKVRLTSFKLKFVWILVFGSTFWN